MAVNSKKGHRPKPEKLCPLPGDKTIRKGKPMSIEQMKDRAAKVDKIPKEKWRPVGKSEPIRM